MWYTVKKDGKYFKSNGYVNSSGRCDTHTWVASKQLAWSTSSLEDAQTVADYNGGEPEECN